MHAGHCAYVLCIRIPLADGHGMPISMVCRCIHEWFIHVIVYTQQLHMYITHNICNPNKLAYAYTYIIHVHGWFNVHPAVYTCTMQGDPCRIDCEINVRSHALQ